MKQVTLAAAAFLLLVLHALTSKTQISLQIYGHTISSALYSTAALNNLISEKNAAMKSDNVEFLTKQEYFEFDLPGSLTNLNSSFVITSIGSAMRNEYFSSRYTSIMVTGKTTFVAAKFAGSPLSSIRKVGVANVDGATVPMAVVKQTVLGHTNYETVQDEDAWFAALSTTNMGLLQNNETYYLMKAPKSILTAHGEAAFEFLPLSDSVIGSSVNTSSFQEVMAAVLFVKNEILESHAYIAANMIEILLHAFEMCRDTPAKCKWGFDTPSTNLPSMWLQMNQWPTAYGYLSQELIAKATEEMNVLFPGASTAISWNASAWEQVSMNRISELQSSAAQFSYSDVFKPCASAIVDTTTKLTYQYICQHTLTRFNNHAFLIASILCCLLVVIELVQVALLIRYRTKQPTKSRFVSALAISCVIIFSAGFGGAWSIIYMYQRSMIRPTFFLGSYGTEMMWIANVYVSYLCGLVTLTVYAWRVVRYYYFRAVYLNLEKQYQNLEQGQTGIRPIHRRLMGTSTYITLCFVSVAVILLIQVPAIMRVSSSKIPKDLLYVSVVTCILLRVAISIILLLIVLVDIVKNRVEVCSKKRIKWFFVFDDPLLYRIEILFELGAILVMLGMLFCIIMDMLGDPTDTYMSIILIAQILLLYYFGFVQGGGMIITIQIAKEFRELMLVSKKLMSNTEEATRKISLENTEVYLVLEDPAGMQLFKQYARNEFSYENVVLFQELMKLKSKDSKHVKSRKTSKAALNTTPPQNSNTAESKLGIPETTPPADTHLPVRTTAVAKALITWNEVVHIYDTFLAPYATIEVNLPPHAKTPVLQIVEKYRSSFLKKGRNSDKNNERRQSRKLPSSPDSVTSPRILADAKAPSEHVSELGFDYEATFGEIELQVLVNLNDTFSRLKKTREYQFYQQEKSFKQKMMKDLQAT